MVDSKVELAQCRPLMAPSRWWVAGFVGFSVPKTETVPSEKFKKHAWMSQSHRPLQHDDPKIGPTKLTSQFACFAVVF